MLSTVNTYETLWKALVWSLKQLWTGKFSDRDMDGELYQKGSAGFEQKDKWHADGWFCGLWLIESDLDYQHQQLRCRHWSAFRPCTWRPCTTSMDDMPWSDFIPATSQWMRHIYNPDDCSAAFDHNLHILFSLPGVTIDCSWPDWMHCKYMGVADRRVHDPDHRMFVVCVYVHIGILAYTSAEVQTLPCGMTSLRKFIYLQE